MAYSLSNGILQIDIADVGEYSGTRFDWTGFITGVTLLEGGHTYCVPESLVPGHGSGGMGLCNEFGISRAIGYEEAAAGEWFPKLGVGLLQKVSDEPYDFFGNYPLIPFKIEEERSAQSVTYTVQPMECRGYSIRLTKKITLLEDRLNISYLLENMGDKPLHTEEYIHNFVGINGASVGPDYELGIPAGLRVEDPESFYTADLLAVSGNSLTWKAEPERPFYCKLGIWNKMDDGCFWELRHKPSGAGVRESGDFAAERMALWGEKHVISPEVFVNISILPRHSKHWSRSYQFFTL
ncbi:hypothetical protein [Paenibacillus riograndensis]|uniref:Aldose 1-epimerase n=2 Tax=Paenibacillus riograndensis TaxID=483937 RepID=A0A0E4H8I4_9BACL|nr:hypothetical protein [Paenibacillus riograndensis]CQR54537.1 hypothetical protein PRIO_2128 [Paenibacillus riograndensis SBR5]